MSLFSEIEKTIERGFRQWTDRMFGASQSGELLLVHHAILEEIAGKVQTVSRGRRVFPFAHVTVTLMAADAQQREVLEGAFAQERRLEQDILEALQGAGCDAPRGFSVDVRSAPPTSDGERYAIDYRVQPAAAPAPVESKTVAPGRLVLMTGKTAQPEYTLERARTNIGRLPELTDADYRVVRRNDVVFEDGADPANATVSRSHAHIKLEAGDYRICDDESEFGTRIFRDGRPIDVPAGNRRGEKLRPGDEIYLGRACLRFHR
jgi:hypothetical protein